LTFFHANFHAEWHTFLTQLQAFSPPVNSRRSISTIMGRHGKSVGAIHSPLFQNKRDFILLFRFMTDRQNDYMHRRDLGGNIKPLSSLWVMMRPPIMRVETPHEVVQPNSPGLERLNI